MKIMISITLLGFSAGAFAQNAIYKCKDEKGHVMFADKACDYATSKALVERPLPENMRAQPTESPYKAAANAEITAAIRAGDFEKADRMAVTADQMQAVAAAKAHLLSAKEKYRQEHRPILCQHISGTELTTCR